MADGTFWNEYIDFFVKQKTVTFDTGIFSSGCYSTSI